MELNHRKLTSYTDCSSSACNNSSQPCEPYCLKLCNRENINCKVIPPPPASYADDNADPTTENPHPKVPTFLIITISFIVATFFFLSCYAIYRYFSARRRRRSQQQQAETGDDFSDEEQGPVNLIDHPIWYIRTTGLQQSIITAITVCKYKKGEGLIEGTECSVCLSEFQEDEDLRLLPKCNHAFHLPCIDTWLRSHINCPMCRAPIVVNPAMEATSFREPGVVDSSSVGSNRQMEIAGNSGEMDGEIEENMDTGLRNEEEEEDDLGDENGRRIIERSNADVEIIQPRRSLSLDSSSAAKINLALSVESDGNLNSGVGGNEIKGKGVTGNENLAAAKGSSSSSRRGYSQSEGSSMKRSGSYNGKNLVSSWYSRSQRKPSLPVRSF